MIAPRSGRPWTLEHDSGSGVDEYEDDELDEREWGLEKGMEFSRCLRKTTWVRSLFK